jgi:hypothetical protein
MPERVRAALRFAGRAILAAALTGALFIAILSFWGLVAAPFVKLSSASPVIAFALAASTAAVAWALSRLWRRPPKGSR